MTLPNFMIIGAAKGGTTSLYHYLRQHPDVYMSPIKETNYYWYEGQDAGRTAVKTREEYERLFDGVTTERAIGEASPQYLNSVTAPERVRRDIPDVKLIVSLRNPADRAYSGWMGRTRNGRETRSAEEALVPGSEMYEHSFYAPRLERWLSFFPRERFHFIIYEEFAADPHRTMRELFAFLGVDPSFVPDLEKRHNTAAMPRSVLLNRLLLRTMELVRPLVPRSLRNRRIATRLHRLGMRPADPIPPELRERLLREYADDIAATTRILRSAAASRPLW